MSVSIANIACHEVLPVHSSMSNRGNRVVTYTYRFHWNSCIHWLATRRCADSPADLVAIVTADTLSPSHFRALFVLTCHVTAKRVSMLSLSVAQTCPCAVTDIVQTKLFVVRWLTDDVSRPGCRLEASLVISVRSSVYTSWQRGLS